jgi:uncharacterized protein (TIGR02118 family)
MPATPETIVTALYPKKGMSRFDMDYYFKHHIPTTKAAWEPLGMTSCIVCELNDEAEYKLSIIMTFKDLSSWEAAKGGNGAKELAADVTNFTDSAMIMLAGKVLEK